MGMRMIIEKVEILGDGVWKAQLAPSEIGVLIHEKIMSVGDISIFGVLNPEYDSATQSLSVEVGNIFAFNMGKGNSAIIIRLSDSKTKENYENCKKSKLEFKKELLSFGDRMFLESSKNLLSSSLAKLAEDLLIKIRSRYPGELREGKARKWINSPKNFFAITIQPKDQSLAINVKGNPDQFFAPSLDIKPDRPSYSRFKLQDESQLSDALSVIFQSAKKEYDFR